MTRARNVVKAAAADGRAIRGVHLTFPAPVIIEVLARSADLHFIYIDGEHGRFDWHDVEIACLTAERCGLTPIARVFDRQAPTISRFLDCGVVGIVAPHVETADDARQVTEAAYFAPIGKRSFGSGRPEYGTEIGDRRQYIAECNARVSVCLMIESCRAIGNIAAMAALPGVDYFSFGLMDLAQDLGQPGDPGHPDVRSAIMEASERVRAAGKRIREDFMDYCWINDLLAVGARHAFRTAVDRPDDFSTVGRSEAKRAGADGQGRPDPTNPPA